jgi:hypothetical protein
MRVQDLVRVWSEGAGKGCSQAFRCAPAQPIRGVRTYPVPTCRLDLTLDLVLWYVAAILGSLGWPYVFVGNRPLLLWQRGSACALPRLGLLEQPLIGE